MAEQPITKKDLAAIHKRLDALEEELDISEKEVETRGDPIIKLSKY